MKFILDKDKLEVQDEDEINSGSIQYYEVPVEKDSSWDNLTIEAVIAPKEGGAIIFDEAEPIAVIDGKMYIDRELSGSYAIGFKGYIIENNLKIYQISTNMHGIYFDIGAGQIIPTNNIPKPTEWEIYVAQMEAIANEASGYADDSEEQAGIAKGHADEAERQAGIATEQAGYAQGYANEAERQAGIATTQAQKAKNEADRAERARQGFEEEVQTATTNFNDNATQKTNAYNENANEKLTQYNNNDTSKTEAYNTNAGNKTNAFNNNANSKTTDFNNNASSKTETFNQNSTDKTNTFNQNASDKKTAFDNNAGSKTEDFNTNAGNKTNAFNENAEEKLDDFNKNAQSYNNRITELEADNESLINTINSTTLDTTDTPSDNITLHDTGEGARLKKFALKGKTEQFTTTGKNLIPLNVYNSSTERQSNFKFNLPINTYTITYNLDDYTMGTNSAIVFYLGLYPDNGTPQQVTLESITSSTTKGAKIVTFTTTEAITINASTSSNIRISETAYNNGGVVKASNIMISVNGGDFEPYTGGIPSPNPNYPQEIRNVEGINIFDLKKYLTDNGVTYTENADGSLTFTPVQALYNNPVQFSDSDTTVSISGIIINGTSADARINVLDSNNVTQGLLNATTSKVENISACKLRINWTTAGTLTMKNIMLNKGGTAKDYVPYNCIQINKWNKNILNYNLDTLKSLNSDGTRSWNNNVFSWNGVDFIINEDGTILVNGTASTATYIILTLKPNLINGENYVLSGCPSGGSTSTYSIRLYKSSSYNSDTGNGYSFSYNDEDIIRINISGNTTISNKLFKPMIEKGTTKTDYIPHAEKTYNFPLSEGQVLMQDGTIEDKVVNPWKIKIFDGTEDGWSIANTGTANFYYRYRYIDNIKYTATRNDFFCNRFSFSNVGGSTTTEGMFITQNGEIRIRFGTEMSLADFKAWLALNPVELQYRLVTPDETDFTLEQQAVTDEIIRDGTYDEVTYYSSNASLNPDIEAVGIKSAKYEIEEIKSAIIALGGNLDV